MKVILSLRLYISLRLVVGLSYCLTEAKYEAEADIQVSPAYFAITTDLHGKERPLIK